MYNLEVFNLSHNAFRELGLQTLEGKLRLRILDLSNAIDKSLDPQTKADLIRYVFSFALKQTFLLHTATSSSIATLIWLN